MADGHVMVGTLVARARNLSWLGVELGLRISRRLVTTMMSSPFGAIETMGLGRSFYLHVMWREVKGLRVEVSGRRGGLVWNWKSA